MPAATQNTPIAAYGAWLAEAQPDWPEAALHSAHRQFIDITSVAVPGAATEVAQKVYATARDWGHGDATVIGVKGTLPPPWAALVNGASAHALDFDDNFDPAKAHATAVLAPALLALAEPMKASGVDCLDAYICGLQIMGRVGQGVNPHHRNRGWHATATVGAIGAAAACARLLRLDPEKAAYALSLATSMAAGFMSQFGSMAKPLHAGLAAKAGVMAASLAQNGVTAGLYTLEGPNAMQKLMIGPDYEHLRDGLEAVEHGQTLRFEVEHIGAPLLITENGFRVKRFPVCGSAHRAIDAVLELREKHGLTGAAVEAVHVHAPVSHLNNLMYAAPADALQAKFSLEYGVAVALIHGDCRLSDFTDEAVARPDARAMLRKVHRHPVDKPESEFPTRVEIHMRDGHSYAMSVAMPRGSNAAPFEMAEYWRKFDGCVEGHMTPPRAGQVKRTLAALRTLADISDLTRLLRAEA